MSWLKPRPQSATAMQIPACGRQASPTTQTAWPGSLRKFTQGRRNDNISLVALALEKSAASVRELVGILGL